MVCPFCITSKTEVSNSRHTKKNNGVWRRRHCPTCGQNFTTNEIIDLSTILHVVNGKKTMPFSRSKLLLSLLRASDHLVSGQSDTLFYLCEIIERALFEYAANTKQPLTPGDISREITRILKRHDTAAYVKYVSYHPSHIDTATLKRQLRS